MFWAPDRLLQSGLLRPTWVRASRSGRWDTHTRQGLVRLLALLAVLAPGSVLADEGDDGGGGDPGVEPVPFSGCGVLEVTSGATDETDCFTFVTHNGRFAIENIGEFEDGDAVCVTGVLEATPCGTDACGEVNGCIINNDIFEAFEGYGSLVLDGGPCTIFETVAGDRYQLTGGTHAGLSPGDGVSVIGRLNTSCTSLCDVPCVELPTIVPGFSSRGTFQRSVDGCPLVLTDDGETLELENSSDFVPGDRVYVSGRRIQSSELCPGSAYEGLEENMISPLLDVCGEVQPGMHGCWNLVTEQGDAFLVDDVSNADTGDMIRVIAAAENLAAPCPQGQGASLRVLEVGRCLAGDVTRDGVVNVDDLIAIILAWGTGDQWADLNGDGVVNVDDLVASLLNWG